ncbi:ATP-grasp domain-containing protein [Streptomyces sp. NBC_01481]|uniref:carboxylate--amine ligase n=1 Tax=Streptomyces sp. NBC_01481 TaxID=2975869 RepID=UPI0022507143|nr:ATP-grasp domain-containing protein [Streptomyces sp. NBC_01481]MCX4585252.1 ATP-grasp domain-containing protein [Streptomyces sp. NBC_01481]
MSPEPLDPEMPALLVKIGRYPQHHGGLGVVRTIGRAGVPVHAVVEHRFTPVAFSRHVTSRFVWPTTGLEEPQLLADGLLSIGRAIGARSIPVPTDDEAAILLAEHSDRLSECFLLPRTPSGLPRLLASKASLFRLCEKLGVPTPRTRAPENRDELVDAGRELGFPLVLKNRDAWTRLRMPAVGNTKMIRDEEHLLAQYPTDPLPPVVMQEYIPREQAEDWITHLYCGAGGTPRVVFTGLKLRSWPPNAGVTTRAVALHNPCLAKLAGDLCRRIGYSGPADLDWRYDRRDGRYKLVDFNPRTGAQFRLFENVHGIDVVRAMHLDLTGRDVPTGPQDENRVFVAGPLDLPSATAWLLEERRLPPAVLCGRGTERAWLSRDDPLPAVVEAVWFAQTVAHRIRCSVRARLAERGKAPPP